MWLERERERVCVYAFMWEGLSSALSILACLYVFDSQYVCVLCLLQTDKRLPYCCLVCRFSRISEVSDNYTTDVSLSSQWYILLAWGPWDTSTGKTVLIPPYMDFKVVYGFIWKKGLLVSQFIVCVMKVRGFIIRSLGKEICNTAAMLTLG